VEVHFREEIRFIESHLRDQVMPFWLEHCLDRVRGGLNNCVADDGTVLSTDRFLWSQGRALWTFSALFHEFDGDPRWLEAADLVARFLFETGPLADGAWPFKRSADGAALQGAESVYADAFVVYGMTEYARAAGNQRALEVAVRGYERVSPLLDDHSRLPTAPHAIPAGAQSHGPSMIFALVFHELGLATGDRAILGRALELAEKVMTQHWKPELGVLLEFVRPGGERLDSDAGKTFLAGHALESMWFMERIYAHHGREDRVAQAMAAIRSHVEKGWDAEFGGLTLASHLDGGKPVWHQPDAKVWWPHTEALVALLRAYEVTGEAWALEWYERVRDYAFRMFPDREHGEWRQNLDREGRPIGVVVKGLQVKDPFHLPRALIYCAQSLRRLAGAGGVGQG